MLCPKTIDVNRSHFTSRGDLIYQVPSDTHEASRASCKRSFISQRPRCGSFAFSFCHNWSVSVLCEEDTQVWRGRTFTFLSLKTRKTRKPQLVACDVAGCWRNDLPPGQKQVPRVALALYDGVLDGILHHKVNDHLVDLPLIPRCAIAGAQTCFFVYL